MHGHVYNKEELVRIRMGAIWWGTGGGHVPPPTHFFNQGGHTIFYPPHHTHILRMMPYCSTVQITN